MFFLKPLSSGGRFCCLFPPKMLLDPPFSFWKKKTTLRSCRHGRWYPSPRPGEWHKQTKLVSRCRWHKLTTKFSGYFLDSVFNGCLGLKRLKGKSMVKRTLYKEKHELSSNVNPNRLLWAGVWGKLQDVEVNFKNVEPNSFLWHGHPSPSYRIMESLQRGIKPPGGFSRSMRTITYPRLLYLKRLAAIKLLATALGDNCVSLLRVQPDKFMGWTMGRDIKILKTLVLDLWNI